jgi:hypothetical protein
MFLEKALALGHSESSLCDLQTFAEATGEPEQMGEGTTTHDLQLGIL